MKCVADLQLERAALAAVSDSPALDTDLLLSHCLQKPRSFLYAYPEYRLSADEFQLFTELFGRRLGGEPIAYLLGYREFWSLHLQVNTHTLIPRPDTESLVEQALQLMESQRKAKVLDLGTGSGAIALALASENPNWQVLAVDREDAAVELAASNARRLALGNVRFIQSDWFSRVSDRFDLVVSNPPYINAEDPHLQQGDLRFEPRSALVAADNGLSDLRVIIRAAPGYLEMGGWLLLEHGYTQAPPVRELLAECGFVAIASGRDYGGQERISWGQWAKP